MTRRKSAMAMRNTAMTTAASPRRIMVLFQRGLSKSIFYLFVGCFRRYSSSRSSLHLAREIVGRPEYSRLGHDGGYQGQGRRIEGRIFHPGRLRDEDPVPAPADLLPGPLLDGHRFLL